MTWAVDKVVNVSRRTGVAFTNEARPGRNASTTPEKTAGEKNMTTKKGVRYVVLFNARGIRFPR